MLQERKLDDRISLHLYAPPVVEAFCKEKTPDSLLKALFTIVDPNDSRVVAEGLSEGLKSWKQTMNWETENDKWVCNMFGPGLHGLIQLEVSIPKDSWGKDMMIYPGYFSMVAFKSEAGITARCTEAEPQFIIQSFDFGMISAAGIYGPQDLLKLCTTFQFSDTDDRCRLLDRRWGPSGPDEGFLSGFLLNRMSTILSKMVAGTQKLEVVDEPSPPGQEERPEEDRYSFWAATPALAKLLRCGDSKTSISVEKPALLDTWQAWIEEENFIDETVK